MRRLWRWLLLPPLPRAGEAVALGRVVRVRYELVGEDLYEVRLTVQAWPR